MKFRFAVIGLLAFAAIAGAQAPFTILRPVNGAKVREQVKVEIPLKSIPYGGFIGIYFDGKFVEAVAPRYANETPPRGTVTSNVFRYLFDTKARKIADGPHTFELVLFGGEGGRKLDSSQVQIIVANNDVSVPRQGVKLRYRFVPGVPLQYRLLVKQYLISVTKEQEDRGATPNEQLLSDDTLTVELMPWRDYGNGTAIIRSRMLPPAFMNISGQKTWISDNRLGTVDQIITNLGHITQTMMPSYYGVWNPDSPIGGGETASDLVIPLLPLPILPQQSVLQGDKWLAKMRFPKNARLSNDRSLSADQMWQYIPSRGELIGFEWAKGYHAARLQYSFKQDQPNAVLPIGEYYLKQVKMGFDQTSVFAFDAGKLLSSVVTLEYEGVNSDPTADQQLGGGFGQPGGGPPDMRRPGPGPVDGSGGKRSGFAAPPGGGFGAPGTGSGGSSQPGQNQKVRIRYVLSMELVK